eukprot:COSAG05_NODE_5893_length_1064_cov_19.835233_1_plen_90_part_00
MQIRLTFAGQEAEISGDDESDLAHGAPAMPGARGGGRSEWRTVRAPALRGVRARGAARHHRHWYGACHLHMVGGDARVSSGRVDTDKRP